MFHSVSIIVTILTVAADCGKVLLFPHDGSHWVNMNILIQELHNKGHHVTVIRPADSWYIKEHSPHYDSITVDFAVGGDEAFFNIFVSRQLQIRREGSPVWTRVSLDMEYKEGFCAMHSTLCEMVIHVIYAQ